MIEISVDNSRAIARLDAFTPKLREELKIGVGRIAVRLVRKVAREKLSGQVLKVRTGRLRRSIGQVVEVNLTSVVGIVSTPVNYAPPHEYGFKGTVSVKASVRTIKQAFGRPIEPKQVAVAAHTASVNLPERSFLRSSLAELTAAGVPLSEIQAAIKRANL